MWLAAAVPSWRRKVTQAPPHGQTRPVTKQCDSARLWQLAGEEELDCVLTINAYPAPPRTLVGAADIAAARVEAVLRVAGGRAGTVVAVGVPQRANLEPRDPHG